MKGQAQWIRYPKQLFRPGCKHFKGWSTTEFGRMIMKHMISERMLWWHLRIHRAGHGGWDFVLSCPCFRNNTSLPHPSKQTCKTPTNPTVQREEMEINWLPYPKALQQVLLGQIWDSNLILQIQDSMVKKLKTWVTVQKCTLLKIQETDTSGFFHYSTKQEFMIILLEMTCAGATGVIGNFPFQIITLFCNAVRRHQQKSLQCRTVFIGFDYASVIISIMRKGKHLKLFLCL